MAEKELIFSILKDDFILQTFMSGGKGGQNQNKRMTGVRIIHKESGAVGVARDSRDQLTNRKNALKRLTESGKFKVWLNRKLWEIEQGKTVEKMVDESMKSNNLKIEGKDESGNWVEIK
jgi:protein subunit release factor A